MEKKQIDVETAFMNPDLDKEIYIKPPEGSDLFVKNSNKMLVKVKKGLYGLKQAAYLWYYDATETLEKLGLRRTASDACLFQGNGIIVLLHVDDFQICATSEQKIDRLIAGLKKKYSIKTVDTNLFLGLHLTENEHVIMVSQAYYATEKLANY